MSATHFYPLRLARIDPDAGARILTFDVPDLLVKQFAFRAGQYLTLRVKIGEAFVDRAYAICSAPHEATLQVAVKHVDGGAMSSWMRDELKPGRWLTLAPPAGSFCIDTAPGRACHYAGFCAGSGVTTLFALLKDILHTEPRSRFTLVLADADRDSVMFLAQMQALERAQPARFRCLLVLRDGVVAHRGMLDAEAIDSLFARALDCADIDQALVVGSPAMMVDTAALLAAQGVPSHRIRTAPAPPSLPARQAPAPQPTHPLLADPPPRTGND